AEGDLFLRTTLYDGDAISVREALHIGVPVIATDNGMRPDGVRLIPISNGAALVEAITSQLTSHEDGLRGPKNAASNKAGVAADDENVAAVFELYRELLG
ncbi:MAG: hypothetical protein WCD76_08045, partial [Pyrinomonadaceae bacterium]